MVVHKPEKPHKCKQYQKEYKILAHLKRHVQTQSGKDQAKKAKMETSEMDKLKKDLEIASDEVMDPKDEVEKSRHKIYINQMPNELFSFFQSKSTT